VAPKNSDILILVIDDEEDILGLFRRILEREGYRVRTETRAESGLDFLRDNHADLVTVDLNMPEMSGIEFMKAAAGMKYSGETIVISGAGSVSTAVEAVKLGAFDYLEKPLSSDKLLVTVRNALRRTRLRRKVARLETEVKSGWEFKNIIGTGPAIEAAKKSAAQLAGADINILLCGETGTGKEIFARAIHNSSAGGRGPFVAVNCSAIAENLLESEMFGHEKGAFTGAVSRRIGHFEHADGGTIFLDEVTELPMPLQAKLLRVVQEKEITRVGSTAPVSVDCRIISATNRDIEEEVKKGAFREDLYYRLDVARVALPPLRERLEDIPLLVKHFLDKHAEAGIEVDAKALDVLSNYPWPGNVRELENVVQRALALIAGSVVTVDHLPERLLQESIDKSYLSASSTLNYHEAQERVMKAFGRDFVEKALRRNEGNVAKSAEQMGISRQSLHRMMKEHGISSRDFKP